MTSGQGQEQDFMNGPQAGPMIMSRTVLVFHSHVTTLSQSEALYFQRMSRACSVHTLDHVQRSRKIILRHPLSWPTHDPIIPEVGLKDPLTVNI